MNYIKKSIREDNFQIKEFFQQLGAQNKDEGDRMFKSLIEEMLFFKNTVKNKPLISFAQTIKRLNYGILESKEAYAYWNETIDQRNISKRAFDHFTREERITDEIIKLNKKQKVVEEEEEKGAEARASPSIKADIWSD
ncbi:hypothetical protein G6F56_003744 [Rhizopus delemar]|uniref:Uncharacterized protein n=1 Tax=Rhizopus stolonifer TaxID=4846 RepID=A0A367JMR5_RHIST|nr:hypothetical protein G6F56_003744 [Rhizopus delemar]RCH91208.1 hypothetical protein CU098_007483 [Rhizopus stolonifer]